MVELEHKYGPLRSSLAIGSLARRHRKARGLTLETVSGVSGLGMRFLSEFERGKSTAELGKVLEALAANGLDVFVVPRKLTTRLERLLAELGND